MPILLRRNGVSRCLATLLSAVIVLMAAPLAGVSGPVREATEIRLTYDFESNGFRVIRLNFYINLGRDGYQAETDWETKGIASLFSGATTAAIVNGDLVLGRLSPREFSMRSRKSGSEKNFKLNWAKNGAIAVKRNYELDPFKARAIASSEKPGMSDPITALLTAAMFSGEQPCSTRHVVYNGKEIFKLSYRKLDGRLIETDAGAYRGPAYRCEIAYQTIAGKSRDKLEELAEEPLGPFRVSMAPVRIETLERPILLPVRLEARASGFDLKAVVVEGTVNGKSLRQRPHAAR